MKMLVLSAAAWQKIHSFYRMDSVKCPFKRWMLVGLGEESRGSSGRGMGAMMLANLHGLTRSRPDLLRHQATQMLSGAIFTYFIVFLYAKNDS
jgi:hypothetical protein